MWEIFINGVVDEREWKENFCVSKASVFARSEEVCPYIQGEQTNMRSPVGVRYKVVCMLYYFSSERRL